MFSTSPPVKATELLAPRANGGAGLFRTFRIPWGLQHDHCKLGQPRLQRALGVAQSARPVVLWRMRVHGGFAFGLSETATTGTRWRALTMEAPRDLSVLLVRIWGQSMLFLTAAWVREVALPGSAVTGLLTAVVLHVGVPHDAGEPVLMVTGGSKHPHPSSYTPAAAP